MTDNKQNTQFRFILAATLSMAVLFGWQYFFTPKKPLTDNANTAQTAATITPVPVTQPLQPQNQPPTVETTPDIAPNKEITIKTPLYQVKLDSKGALATSWVLIKNVSEKNPAGKSLYADGSNKENEKPLELISPEALKRNPREIPFRLSTGDQNLDAFLNQRNYQVSVNEETIELGAGETQKIDFILRDEASGIEAVKSFTFSADNYVTDLQVKLTKNGQPVPNTKLLIGASLGDQGIAHHNYYHIESEGIAFVNGSVERHLGTALVTGEKSEGSLQINGNVDWAGVADTYFAMAAIPAVPTQGLEYHASKYEVETAPFYDGIISWITRNQKTSEVRHLITAYVPILVDGSTTKIYTGTKDYFTLSDYNQILTNSVGRPIDIEDLINYGWFRFITKPLAVPILYSLNFLYNLTNNYGTAIIIFTFLFYSLLFPLRWYQSKSFKKSAANAPKMKELQERLKEMQKKGIAADDPRMRELQMEQLKMTKDALPIGGCLPMLLQFPLLIALYVAVTISLGFRQATFLWLPDLSAGDPYHFLEFIFAGSMILSMKFTPQAAVVTPEQQMQQKMMTYFMPVMMLWIMWSAPAGLLIYWLFGNIVSFVQQIIINHVNKPTEPPTAEIVESVPKNAKKVKPKFSTS
ncbi:membrane protein insertase YidC [soil metagenome]